MNEVRVKVSCSLFHLLFCCYTENAASIGYSKGNYCLHGTQDTMQTSIKKLKRLRNKVLNALLCIFKSSGGENMYLVTGAINEQQTRASLGPVWLAWFAVQLWLVIVFCGNRSYISKILLHIASEFVSIIL